MIDLHLLGPIELSGRPTGDAAAAVLRQPKRLALLAYLALAGRGGFVRRDAVLAAFWPELDTTRARAALRQSLHFLRQQLGDDLLDTRGDDLAVCAAHVRTDVAAFDAAIAAERWGEAAALYRGALLEGFHPAGVGEAFEEWLARERARLHDGARLAVDELGREAEANGDLRGAVRWARRAVELAPLHEATTRRLMRLLDAAGDPAGAVVAYEALERRLREERGAVPSAATVAVAEECRRMMAQAADGGAPASIDATPTPGAVEAMPVGAPVAAPIADRAGERRLRPALLVTAVAALLVLALGIGWWSGHADAEVAGEAPIRLVVLPFDEFGEDDGNFLVTGMAEAITTRLSSISRLHVIDPQSAARYRGSGLPAQAIGDELDAAYVLRGTVRWGRGPDGAPVAEVTPILVRTVDGAVRWTGAPYEVSARDVFEVQTAIAGDVATALDVDLTREERRMLARPPATDPQAYREFVHGVAQLREWQAEPHRGTLDSAVESLGRATRRDTTFALAFARLAEARLARFLWRDVSASADSGDLHGFQRALDRARQLEPELPEAIAAHGRYLAHVVGDTAAAFEAFDRASALRPGDADLLVNRVRYPMSSGAMERDLALLERALRLDPRSERALLRIVLLTGTMRRYAEEDHYAARLTATAPREMVGYLHGAKAALNARGDTLRAQRLITEGLRRASLRIPLVQELHVLGDEHARVLDTLRLESLVTEGSPTTYDSSFYLQARFETAQRVGGPEAIRAAASAYLRFIEGIPAPQLRALRGAVVHAALGNRAEAERAVRMSEEHSDAQVREAFAGGDTVEVRRIQGAVGYDLARAHAVMGNAERLALHLRRAFTAPHGVTPHYVRLDPAFRQWLGKPGFERLLAEYDGTR